MENMDYRDICNQALIGAGEAAQNGLPDLAIKLLQVALLTLQFEGERRALEETAPAPESTRWTGIFGPEGRYGTVEEGL